MGEEEEKNYEIVVINVVASRKHRPLGVPTARANPFLILHNRNQKLAAISVRNPGRKTHKTKFFMSRRSALQPSYDHHF